MIEPIEADVIARWSP